MNKQQASGFFMTEFLIYMLLSACMSIFILRYIYGTTMRLRMSTQHTERVASLYASLDAMCNDLQKAPCAVSDWRTLLAHELMWQQGDTIIGWKLDDGVLKRSVQTFDRKKECWKRSVHHVAQEDVQAVEFAPEYVNKELHAMTVAITGRVAPHKTYQCKRTVKMQQRVLV